jgi:alkanesulfonate monooxygenase SsuD/methylene tetrahydromethanopterin reductase-like flavin-dependent oxidoreductase (luciferase family)
MPESKRPLRVGIQLPEVEREVRWPEYIAMAKAAEDTGFDTIWLGDHLLYRYSDGSTRGPWEVFTSLAAIAQATSRVKIGPLVAATAFHAPPMLAKMAATVDEISGGRLILGLGAGWNDVEFQAFGFPFDHRISRFEEAFTIIRTLLREGEIDFDGRFFQARDCVLKPSPRPGGPPLMVGSIGPRMLEITLPHVEQWNVWYRQSNNSPEGLAPIVRDVDAACRAVGRDPGTLEKTSAVLVRLEGGAGRIMGERAAAPIPPLEGSMAAIADGLRAYAALGLAEVQLVVDPITQESIEALGAVLADLDRG